MRIFDRVASGETVHLEPGIESGIEVQSSWRKMAHTATRIVADEASQFKAQSDCVQHVADGDYGVLNPPFELMWIEWKTPRYIVIDSEWVPRQPMYAATVVQQKDQNTLSLTSLISFDRAPICIFPLYVEIANFSDVDSINALGELVYESDQMFVDPIGTADEAIGALGDMISPAYLAIGWMNCRNVTTRNECAPSRMRAKRTRRGQPTGLDYKRIVLDERTQRALESNRLADSHGQRLHIVRGHMRTYTSERPAFGSYVGNMWIHQHMRGDADLGRINHEYHVTSRGAQ